MPSLQPGAIGGLPDGQPFGEFRALVLIMPGRPPRDPPTARCTASLSRSGRESLAVNPQLAARSQYPAMLGLVPGIIPRFQLLLSAHPRVHRLLLA